MDTSRINVFIPAAGKGERLRPITDHIPKPLMPLLGKPALQRVIERVSALPVNRIGVNAHYMKAKLRKWVPQSPFRDDIVLLEEDEVTGTGGALKNAERLLSRSTFLVHNSDVVSDVDLEKLIAHHRESGSLVTLAVHDHPEFNNVVIDESGSLIEIRRKGISPPSMGGTKGGGMAFTGIAVYEPGFLAYLPDGGSSVVDAWLKAVSAGEKIGTYDVSGCYWSDIGTPASYASAVFHMLRRDGETVYVHPAIKKCDGLELEGHVVIEEKCVLGGTLSLSNCIMLPGCDPGRFAFSRHENYILGPGFRIKLEKADMFGLDENGDQLIGTGGSDREYYRTADGNILMRSSDEDPDYDRQVEYTALFLKQGVPVPRLIRAQPELRQAVFEDAGDISLYSWLKCPRSAEAVEWIYKKALDAVAKMHLIRNEDLDECELLRKRVFDRDYFRWETDYFIERFVKGLWRIDIDNGPGLASELDELAAKAGSFPKTVIHRDLQSRNIMIRKENLYLIDFQGARTGPPAYDIASLLWDPYHALEEEMRDTLLDYYLERMAADVRDFDEAVFRDSLIICRLQRHMQALGAYGFLSRVKGKKYFLKHVPEALRLLKEDIEIAGGNYPVLKKLIMEL